VCAFFFLSGVGCFFRNFHFSLSPSLALDRYWSLFYPYDRVSQLLSLMTRDSADGPELMLRLAHDKPPIRHVFAHHNEDELRALLVAHTPADGLHACPGQSADSAFVIDVDNDRTFELLCACRDGGRDVCDNCWVRLAGAMRAYIYLLRHRYSCTRVLATFSGGRGWHLIVFDAHTIDRPRLMRELTHSVPCVLEAVCRGYNTLVTERPDMSVSLASFDTRIVHARHLTSNREEARSFRRPLIDAWMHDLYGAIMLPYFQSVWLPRVLGPRASISDGVECAAAMLAAAHTAATHQKCAQCTVMLTYAAARRRYTKTDLAVPVHLRIDIFLVVMSLLWIKPDEEVASPNHMLRVPFSPHLRTGNIALPVDPVGASDLTPRTRPLRATDIVAREPYVFMMYMRALAIVDELVSTQPAPSPRSAAWTA